MASRPDTLTARHPRITRKRVALAVIAIIVLLAIVDLGVGWYYAGEIESGGFRVDHSPPKHNMEVVEVRAGEIVLTSQGDDNWNDPAIWGLEGEAGYGRLGEILAEDETAVTEYSKKIRESVKFITPEVEKKLQTSDVVSKAEIIALLYSKNGGAGCGDSKFLIDNIKRLDGRLGCCSDHAEVFIALSHIFGLESREVHHTIHTFNEFYDPKKGKWIWVDTQYAIMAKDDKNNFLSMLEMMKFMKEGRTIVYHFFGMES